MILEYSVDALNVKSEFYDCDKIVYVEGDDDVLFWEFLFGYFTNLKIKCEALGSSTQLDLMIPKVVNGEVLDYIARDADYLTLNNENINHQNIFYTYGYSIENSLYLSESLRRIIRVWCRGSEIKREEVQGWIDDFCEKTKHLILYDIANYKFKCSNKVLGDNCSMFLASAHSHIIDQEKVNASITTISNKIPREFFNQAELLFNGSGYQFQDVVKGHFFVSGIQKFIQFIMKKFGRNAGLSFEALYSNAVLIFDKIFSTEHPHYAHYQSIFSAT
jgi:hypothetical protein